MVIRRVYLDNNSQRRTDTARRGAPSGAAAAQNVAGASGSSNDAVSISSQAQVIIGVVVGGVVLIAITAGILFLLQRKRKWERIRKHEEQLLALNAAPGYKSSSRSKESDRYCSSRRGSSPSRPSQQLSRSSAEKSPPRYQRRAHPNYIPLTRTTRTYHDEERPVSTTEILNGRRTPFLGAVVAPREFERGHDRGQRPSSYHQSFGRSHQLVVPRSREQFIHVRSHSELSSMMAAHSNSMDEPRSSSQMERVPSHHRHSASTSSAPLPNEGHLPKRPKPVLSRLVTNF